MDSEKICIMDDDTNSFESFLKLCSIYYKKNVLGTKQELISEIEKILIEIKIDDVCLIHNSNGLTTFKISGTLKNSCRRVETKIRYNHYTARVEKEDYDYKFDSPKLVNNLEKLFVNGWKIFEIIINLTELLNFQIEKNFNLKNQAYNLIVDFPNSDCEVGRYARIRIANKEKMDTFYYSLIDNELFMDSGSQFIPIPPATLSKIFLALPNISCEDMNFLLKRVFDEYTIVYKNDDGDTLNYFQTLMYGIKHNKFNKGYLFEIPEKKKEKEEISLSFSQIIAQSGEIIEIGKNSEEIKESIKNILTKLKTQDFDRTKFAKIRISSELFYKSITSTKKEIDPFFKDPKIMELCDLSKIDFTNADIAGFSFEGTGANIILNQIYDQSIKNTNLRGINLMFQDLNGIIADDADLRETGVFVEIDKTSIIGTKFSSSTGFMLGVNMISYEMARTMGISVEEEPDKGLQLLMH